MSDCPFKPYCNEDCTACTDEDKAEKIDRVVDALQPIVANIVEVLTPAIQEAMTAINNMWRAVIECYPNRRAVIECYPNRRVVHLALHHRKKRIRKKNTNRIILWLRE